MQSTTTQPDFVERCDAERNKKIDMKECKLGKDEVKARRVICQALKQKMWRICIEAHR